MRSANICCAYTIGGGSLGLSGDLKTVTTKPMANPIAIVRKSCGSRLALNADSVSQSRNLRSRRPTTLENVPVARLAHLESMAGGWEPNRNEAPTSLPSLLSGNAYGIVSAFLLVSGIEHLPNTVANTCRHEPSIWRCLVCSVPGIRGSWNSPAPQDSHTDPQGSPGGPPGVLWGTPGPTPETINTCSRPTAARSPCIHFAFLGSGLGVPQGIP